MPEQLLEIVAQSSELQESLQNLIGEFALRLVALMVSHLAARLQGIPAPFSNTPVEPMVEPMVEPTSPSLGESIVLPDICTVNSVDSPPPMPDIVTPAPIRVETPEIRAPEAEPSAPRIETTTDGDLLVRTESLLHVCKLSKQQRTLAQAFHAAENGVLDYTVAVELLRPASDKRRSIPLETLERRLRTVLSKINRKLKDVRHGTPLYFYNNLSVKRL